MVSDVGSDELIALDEDSSERRPCVGFDERLLTRNRYVVCGIQKTSTQKGSNRKGTLDAFVGGVFLIGGGVLLYVTNGLPVVSGILVTLGVCGLLGALGVGGGKKSKCQNFKSEDGVIAVHVANVDNAFVSRLAAEERARRIEALREAATQSAFELRLVRVTSIQHIE